MNIKDLQPGSFQVLPTNVKQLPTGSYDRLSTSTSALASSQSRIDVLRREAQQAELAAQQAEAQTSLPGVIGGALPTIGAIAGGTGGAILGAAGGPIGSYAGAVGGTGVGAAAGEAANQEIQRMLGTRERADVGQAAKTGMEFGALEAVLGPIAAGAAPLVKGIGSTIFKAVIPKTATEATLLQSYNAQKPMIQNLFRRVTGEADKPVTAGQTALQKGFWGTEGIIGTQAKRESKKVWSKTIEPALKSVPDQVDMKTFFDEAEQAIVKNTPELGDQTARREALTAIREEYATKPSSSFRELQDLKAGWASHVPAKAYRGKDITGVYNNVRNELASLARKKIYDKLGPEMRRAYIDYGNLQALQEMGTRAMSGGGRQSFLGGIWGTIKDIAVVPVGTIGGQVLYRTGQGVELIGPANARTVYDVVYGLSREGEDSEPQIQEESQ